MKEQTNMTKKQKIHKIVRDIRYDSNSCDGDLYMDKTIEVLFSDVKSIIVNSSLYQNEKNELILKLRKLQKKWKE